MNIKKAGYVDNMKYTGQAPPLSDQEIESMLKGNRRAIICTHNVDGTIHAVPVDYRYMDGRVMLLSFETSRKTRNIKRNKNVTVLVFEEPPPKSTSFKGIMIYGKAKLEYDNVLSKTVTLLETSKIPREKLQRFVQAYLEKVKCVIVRIKPEHMVSFDYSKDEVYKDLAKLIS